MEGNNQDEQAVELAAAYHEAGIVMPPDPQVSWVREKCHEMLVEIRNSGVHVIRQRGLDGWRDVIDHGTTHGIHRRTVRFHCRECKKIVSYDEARPIGEACSLGEIRAWMKTQEQASSPGGVCEYDHDGADAWIGILIAEVEELRRRIAGGSR